MAQIIELWTVRGRWWVRLQGHRRLYNGTSHQLWSNKSARFSMKSKNSFSDKAPRICHSHSFARCRHQFLVVSLRRRIRRARSRSMKRCVNSTIQSRWFSWNSLMCSRSARRDVTNVVSKQPARHRQLLRKLWVSWTASSCWNTRIASSWGPNSTIKARWLSCPLLNRVTMMRVLTTTGTLTRMQAMPRLDFHRGTSIQRKADRPVMSVWEISRCQFPETRIARSVTRTVREDNKRLWSQPWWDLIRMIASADTSSRRTTGSLSSSA